MVKRGTGSTMEQLKEALTRSLKESVEDAVISVCNSFQQAVATQTATATGTTDGSGDYDLYYDSCRRLVDYIEKNMVVSPGFKDQMERVILACHSGASERVLNSVVTKKLWFHRHGDTHGLHEKQMKQNNRRSSNSGDDSGSTKLANKKKKAGKVTLSSAPSTKSTSIRTRSATGKKRSVKKRVDEAYPSKRPRRAAKKAIVYDTSDEEHKFKEEQEIQSEDERNRRNRTREEKVEKVQPFEDAIGEMCYPDQRTPTQTKFFKDRLRKSIQFVDALLCNPPSGKVCGRGCKKIRAQMCSSSTPCKNKMCRIWHHVEAHTDHCLNSQCEFKNRILLRETMHKLKVKEQQLAAVKAELNAKHAELEGAIEDDMNALKDNIASLELQLHDHTSEFRVLEETKKAFWDILNKIGVEVSDDVVDGFPDFGTHYVDRKVARKARKAVAAPASRSSSLSTSHLRTTPRTANASSHGSDDDYKVKMEDFVDSDNTNGTTHQRATRRGSSSERHNAQELISGDNNLTSEDKTTLASPESMEPPLPHASSPPIRQNPEIVREYTVRDAGYSIHPAADDLESPAIIATSEITQTNEEFEATKPNEGQSTDIQQASNKASGVMVSISSNLTPDMPPSTNLADPLFFEEHSTTSLSSIPPSMESFNVTTSSSTPVPAETLQTTDGTAQSDQLQQSA
ncbi:hypothetical protein PsorP6_004000 [Peronosclerospora sorghi]|uniref:Uncharacterized protein n=1 Tax=Peronosclerospora sorghi TaxID=230839 RepID=A0ACC0VQJ9_9STRA|nr:hypothetical protein PsorP6_004000 [Peronosclerospora sorghi]